MDDPFLSFMLWKSGHWNTRGKGRRSVNAVKETHKHRVLTAQHDDGIARSNASIAYFLSAGWFTPSYVGTPEILRGLIPSKQATLNPY